MLVKIFMNPLTSVIVPVLFGVTALAVLGMLTPLTVTVVTAGTFAGIGFVTVVKETLTTLSRKGNIQLR